MVSIQGYDLVPYKRGGLYSGVQFSKRGGLLYNLVPYKKGGLYSGVQFSAL